MNQGKVCAECSAEAYIGYTCNRCGTHESFCKGHEALAQLGAHICDPIKKADKTRRQIGRRGDFAIDKQIIGEQDERRYFLCGPDDANQGITLANLEAVWHLLGEVIVDEKRSNGK